VLSPQQTQGPYYLDLNLVRSDIREDRDGIQLRLALELLDVDNDCAPIRDAVVAVWHADASGVYSGFAGQPGGVDTTGETFLRGYQVTDANGRAEFITIYPGWYMGRTVHIHLMVHLGSSSVLTSQLYFDDSLTDAVYAQAPYDTRPDRDTTNDTDSVIRTGGVTSLSQVVLDVVAEGTGYAATMVIGVTAA
jgi:protocatechuate 3,4-dioxygenase beta subunit